MVSNLCRLKFKFTNLIGKPFGNGMRACAGRLFFWQETYILVATILQNFRLREDNPDYKLEIKQSLTTKPKGYFVRASLRDGVTAINLERLLFSANVDGQQRLSGQTLGSDADFDVDPTKAWKPLRILYGSNAGTCEALATRLGRIAYRRGIQAEVYPLDTAVRALPKHLPIVIICASYEGAPPDNATEFVEWLSDLKSLEASEIEFAAFGCGHSKCSNLLAPLTLHLQSYCD